MGNANTKEFVLAMGDFNGHVNKQVDKYKSMHKGNGVEKKNSKERML